MKNIAIIPARGGSKRIPRKNIKDFFGKPILAYSIDVALRSKIFDEVIVSTEDYEIAEIAKSYGASVPFFRSEITANDHATMEDVVSEVLLEYKKQGILFENFCCILPTAPFLSIQSIQKSFDIFKNNSYDALLPVLRFSYPIQRALKIEAGKVVMREAMHIHTRSQDLEPMFHDAGLFYWMNVHKFFEIREIFCDNTGMIELSEMEVQDIDTAEDWCLAEFKYAFMKSQKY